MSKPVGYYSYPKADVPHFDQLINQFGAQLQYLGKDEKYAALAIASQAVLRQQSFSQVAADLDLQAYLPAEFCDCADPLSEAGLLSLCDSLINQLRWR